MTYDQWPDEYLKSALETKKQLDLYKTKLQDCRSPSVAVSYEHKVKVLTEMYADCMYDAGCLRRKANAARARGLQNMEVM